MKTHQHVWKIEDSTHTEVGLRIIRTCECGYIVDSGDPARELGKSWTEEG